MASILKENEVRVNSTCISISRSLYDQVKPGDHFVFASVSYGSRYSNRKNRVLNIHFSQNPRQGVSVDTVNSNYQVSFEHYTNNESHQGLYKYISINGNKLEIEQINIFTEELENSNIIYPITFIDNNNNIE